VNNKAKMKQDILELAKEFAGNWCYPKRTGWSGSYGKEPDKHPQLWGCYYFNKDSLAGESNMVYIEKALKKYIGKTVIEIRDSHFACGAMEGLLIKGYKPGGKTLTKAFEAFAEMYFQMEQYYLLDEDDYYQREWALFKANLTEQMQFACNIQNDGEYCDDCIEILCDQFYEKYNPDTSEDVCFPEKELAEFVAGLGLEPREKMIESEYNGTYRKKEEFFCAQWYPGVGRFYVIFNNKAGRQASLSSGQLLHLIRGGWVKQ